MPSPLVRRALLLAVVPIVWIPSAALAEDEPPYAGPSATTVIVNVGTPAPVAPVAPIEPVAAPAEDPCHWGAHAHARGPWKSRLRGRLALGVSAGHVENKDDTEGRQHSLIARATGRRGFGIELELAKTKLGDDTAKTFGGALFKAFGQRRLAPYVIAGAGKGILDRADRSESHVKFAEVGAGLMVRGRRISIGVDVRRGVRKVDAAEATPDAMPVDATIERTVSPEDDHDRGERYTRARVVALVTF